MNNFIKALYADLIHRIDLVVDDLKSTAHHDDIRERFVGATLILFLNIRTELENALYTDVLEVEMLRKNNLSKYNKLHREFKEIHSYRYLAIKNYREAEVFFHRLIESVYAEHRINMMLPPIVSTISNHDYYYWAVPYYEIIALPAGEEHCLLNLPDMYHEIGHLLQDVFKKRSCERTQKMADAYFDREIAAAQTDELSVFLTRARYLWRKSWLEEFSCDLVGTYMTGAAYAWTNLKLIATHHGSPRIFEDSNSHPADEARMRIIIFMLEKMGLHDEKMEVEATWDAFLRDSVSFIPDEYPVIFPPDLLSHLVDEFYEFYQNADLVAYTDLPDLERPAVSRLLNDAWQYAQNDPAGYLAYEMGAIKGLREQFGLWID